MQTITSFLLLLATICLLNACTVPSRPDANLDSAQTASLNNASASPTISNRADIPLQCQVQALRPALFRSEEQRVLVVDGTQDYKNIPATVEWSELVYQIEPSRYPHETIPATYKEVEETVEIERARLELYAVPAEYRTVKRKLLQHPQHIAWKANCYNALQPDQCIQEQPDRYIEIEARMVDKPARIQQRQIPKRTETIKRKVLIKPGQGTGIPLPARYQTVKVLRVVKPWRIESQPIKPRYETITIERKLRESRLVNLPALCADKASTTTIERIQASLQQAGHTVAITGQLDVATERAVIEFQRANGLALGGITLETLRKLGLA